MNIYKTLLTVLITANTINIGAQYYQQKKATTAISSFQSLGNTMQEKFDTTKEKIDAWLEHVEKKYPRLFILGLSSSAVTVTVGCSFLANYVITKIRNKKEDTTNPQNHNNPAPEPFGCTTDEEETSVGTPPSSSDFRDLYI